MQILNTPKEISIKDVLKKKSLSPNNYKTISIKRKEERELSYYLKSKDPYSKGEEPGSMTYVKDSNIKFLRNSCIDRININFYEDKLISLNPKYGFENKINNYDVLMCKDANISDACLVIKENNDDIIFSSGIVKLNFKEEKYKYYGIAFFNDDYFYTQLDSKTPKGSTMKHSGDKFLECKLPLLREDEEWVYDYIESLVKNVAYCEHISYEKIQESVEIIEKELTYKKKQYNNPNISQLLEKKRADAGIYSETVFDMMDSIKMYTEGYKTIEEYGFKLKRGTNLQKRDLGRSVKSKTYKKNFNILVYPSDISDGGYISKMSYIGARNQVNYLKRGDILFSAEGTVGKVFVVCNEELKFITNIHGMIIYSDNSNNTINDSIYIGLFLNYLRVKGVIERLTAGGQGGSLAVGYWDNILIPNFRDEVKKNLSELYYKEYILNPYEFDLNKLHDSGIFQLNNFRILCNSLIKNIVNDIKNDELKSQQHYNEVLGK